MKNCLISVLFFYTSLAAQNPFNLKVLGMEGADGLLYLPQSGFVWAGIQGACIELIRLDLDGHPVWTKSICPVLQGTDISYGNLHLASAEAGKFYLLFRKGAFSSAPDNYLVLMQFDTLGNLLWESALPPQKRYGPFSSGNQLLVQPNGQIWAAHGMGFTDAYPDFNQALFYKVDATGTIQLRRFFKTSEPAGLNGLASGPSGTFFGYGSLGFSIHDGFLMHLSANGDLLKTFRYQDFHILRDGGLFSDGDLALMGKHGDKFSMVRLHPDGLPVWAVDLPDSLSLFQIRVTSEDDVVLSVRKGSQHFGLVCLDGNTAEMLWANQVEDCSLYKTTAVTASGEGGVVVAQTNLFGGLLSRLFTVDREGIPGMDCPFFPVDKPVFATFTLHHGAMEFTQTDISDQVADKVFTTMPAQLSFLSCCPSEPVTAHFMLPDSVCTHTPVSLSAEGNTCAESWVWALNGSLQPEVTTEAVQQAVWETPGQYLVRLETSIGACQAAFEDTLLVVHAPEISLFAVQDTAVCPDKPFAIKAAAQGFDQWTWQDGFEGSERIWHTPQEGLWVLQAVQQHCAVTDTLEVRFADCGPPPLYVPNVFSPNEDGVNDTWEVYFQAGLTPVSCSIYDRWGNLCYHTNEKEAILWNGYSGNQKAISGVYTWQLRFRTYTGTEEQRSGDLLLLR